MLDEFIKKGDNELLQKACQKFSNNKERNQTYFTEEKWENLCREKGIENIPPLPNREDEYWNKYIEKRASEKNGKMETEDVKQHLEETGIIQYEELKENYEQTNQTEKEKAMEELKKRAMLIIKMSQQEMGGQGYVAK